MVDKPGDADLHAAFDDLHQYLSDQIAPLMVAESIALLMRYKPDAVAGQVRDWAAAQYRRGGEQVSLADYFYHAVKKLHMIGALKREELAARKDAVALGLMRAIKQALDPNGIMNPGRVLQARTA